MKRISIIITVEIVKGITSSSHYSIKLVKVEHSISVSVCLFQHFLQFVVWYFLAHFCGDSFQIFEGDFIEVIFIEKLEDFEDFLFGVSGALNGR